MNSSPQGQGRGDTGEDRQVKRMLFAKNLLLTKQVAALSQAVALRSAVASHAAGALDSLLRRLDARLEALGGEAAATAEHDGPAPADSGGEARWLVEAVRTIEAALEAVMSRLRSPPEDVADFDGDDVAFDTAGAAPGASVRAACLAHLREPAPLLQLEKALFRTRAALLAVMREGGAVGAAVLPGVEEIDLAMDTLFRLAAPTTRDRRSASRLGACAAAAAGSDSLRLIRGALGHDTILSCDEFDEWERTLRGEAAPDAPERLSLAAVALRDQQRTHGMLQTVEELVALMPGNLRSKPECSLVLTRLVRAFAKIQQDLLANGSTACRGDLAGAVVGAAGHVGHGEAGSKTGAAAKSSLKQRPQWVD